MFPGEEKVFGELVYKGRILNLRVDRVRLPDGGMALREVVEHAPAVGIIAETGDGSLFLVRQYRYAAGEFLLEIPAGIVEPNEEPVEAADREMREETGFKPGVLTEVAQFYTSPGFSDERIILFYARELSPVPKGCDSDEFLDLVRLDRGQLQEAVLSGEIRDSKTLTAIYWFLSR